MIGAVRGIIDVVPDAMLQSDCNGWINEKPG